MDIKKKKELDDLLEKHQAQPVGIGYIDIIVKRDSYKSFVRDVLDSGFKIKTISWWEYVPDRNEPNTYGMGGPKSRFHSGWFAELGFAYDDLNEENETSYAFIIDTIENKVLDSCVGTLSFKESASLTPAFWLKIDKSWKNNQYA